MIYYLEGFTGRTKIYRLTIKLSLVYYHLKVTILFHHIYSDPESTTQTPSLNLDVLLCRPTVNLKPLA